MRLIKKETVARFRMVIIALNCLLASLSLINLYTVASGAIKVDIPEENDFAWTIDTKTEEASFLADFTVENQGVYDINDLDIHATITTQEGTELIDYRQENLEIPSGQVKRFNIFAIMPFENVDMDELKSLMVNDSIFYLDVDITANYLWGLGKFVVDDTLKYDWEAPFNNLGNQTDDTIVQLISYIISKNSDLDGLVDFVSENIQNIPLMKTFDWNNADLRIESWPMGGNESKIIVLLTMDILGGRRTLTFELKFLLDMDGEENDLKFQTFNFRYK
jgi:hypothetical protein